MVHILTSIRYCLKLVCVWEREREREREIFSLLNLSRKRLRQVFHSNRESEEQKMGKKSMPHWTVTRRAD